MWVFSRLRASCLFFLLRFSLHPLLFSFLSRLLTLSRWSGSSNGQKQSVETCTPTLSRKENSCCCYYGNHPRPRSFCISSLLPPETSLRWYPERARTGVRPKRHWEHENDLSTNISLPVPFSILDDWRHLEEKRGRSVRSRKSRRTPEESEDVSSTPLVRIVAVEQALRVLTAS